MVCPGIEPGWPRGRQIYSLPRLHIGLAHRGTAVDPVGVEPTTSRVQGGRSPS
jgi:hypothetical protein